MPVPLDEVDEVWLGLTLANQELLGFHHPTKLHFDGTGCSGCNALWYIQNAMKAYRQRLTNQGADVSIPHPTTPPPL